MEWIEVTDPSAPEGWADWEVTKGLRPDKTLADWIAAGADVGEVEVTPIAWVKPMHGEECPSKGCVSCSSDALNVQEFALTMRRVYRENLAEYGVHWDPTITF